MVNALKQALVLGVNDQMGVNCRSSRLFRFRAWVYQYIRFPWPNNVRNPIGTAERRNSGAPALPVGQFRQDGFKGVAPVCGGCGFLWVFNRIFTARPRHDCLGTASMRGAASQDSFIMLKHGGSEHKRTGTRSVRRASGLLETGFPESCSEPLVSQFFGKGGFGRLEFAFPSAVQVRTMR
jgi:hypothetical protein